jgi:phosphinothricin acetyltransferase
MDAEAISRIYNHYVRQTIVTFEDQPVLPAEMTQRIQDIASASLPWLVAEAEGRLVGYAYGSPWRRRSAYRFSVETTVYLAADALRRGTGTSLYRVLLGELRRLGFHVVIGAIALPNPASVALHEKLGFAKVAHFPEVGFKFGQWIDVGYWELAL